LLGVALFLIAHPGQLCTTGGIEAIPIRRPNCESSFADIARYPNQALFVRGAQQLFRLLGPAEANELDEAQHVAPVSAPGVGAAVPGGPALEHLGDTPVEAFSAGLERRREMARPTPAAFLSGTWHVSRLCCRRSVVHVLQHHHWREMR
jgi:hypothetical protein